MPYAFRLLNLAEDAVAKSGAHIPELDGVRGLACLLVILLHVVVAPLPLMPDTWFDLVRFRIQPFMSGGVDLFFILSGFLISGALMDSRGSPNYFKSFWVRRIARIFPVYYLMILVSIIARLAYDAAPLPTLHAITNQSLPEFYYAIFSQNIVMALTGASGNNILGVTWSLAIEEQFYLIFPFLVFLVPRRWLVVSAIAVFLATPLVRAIVVAEVNWQAGYLFTIARMDALMLGVIMAAVVRHEAALTFFRRWRQPLNVVAAVVIAMQVFDVWGAAGEAWRLTGGNQVTYIVLICVQYPLINLSMALLLMNVFAVEENLVRRFLRTKALAYLGLISYGAYMYHQSINYALWRWAYSDNPRDMSWSQAYMPVLVLALTAIVAIASYRYFEMPARRWITGTLLPKKSPAPPILEPIVGLDHVRS
jgi:peptidoglycan/LPS O-acetylase OafA/YrhL